jgi:hypothetical protein
MPRGADTIASAALVTETRNQIGISKEKPSDRFAGKWLRAPDLLPQRSANTERI